MRIDLLTAAVLFVGFSSAAMAASECPFIRPPGLTPAQVDSVVVSMAARQLGKPPGSLDLHQSFKILDGTENAILTYSFSTLAIAHALGFDAVRAFYDAAQAKKAKHPFEVLSIEEMQDLSRKLYFSGTDSLPPIASEGVEYQLLGVPVKTPSPASGWLLLRCDSERILFQRPGSRVDQLSTAIMYSMTLPPYEKADAFVSLGRSAIEAALPAGFFVESIEVRPAEGFNSPCISADLSASSGKIPFRMRARICYQSKTSKLGYASIYGESGDSSSERFSREADSFIAGAGLK